MWNVSRESRRFFARVLRMRGWFRVSIVSWIISLPRRNVMRNHFRIAYLWGFDLEEVDDLESMAWFMIRLEAYSTVEVNRFDDFTKLMKVAVGYSQRWTHIQKVPVPHH